VIRPLCARTWTRALLAAFLIAWISCGGNATDDAPGPSPKANASTGELKLPARAASIKFAVIGDSGRGNRWQYEVAAQMIEYRRKLPYDFVLMLGDNVYDGGTPADYRDKFELPYKPLLDEGVKFYAVIGNHDDPNQQWYEPFNTGGQRYYTFDKRRLGGLVGPEVRFFMLDTERLDDTQLAWFRREASKARERWKIAVFHRPIYTSGRYERPARLLRSLLEPIILETGVRVAFSGHEHFYERTVPQRGVVSFLSGAAGSLRLNDLRRTPLTAAGFDQDYHFMLIEIDAEALHFQAITRAGETIDSGSITHSTQNSGNPQKQ
jgi:3',5'-cyclic AMP phosphodiesterase CpdA